MYTFSIVENDMFAYEQMMSYCVLTASNMQLLIPDKVTCVELYIFN